MAWFTFRCPTHGEFKKSLQKREKAQPCPSCGQASDTILKPTASISVVEKLDNGAMSRSVERLHNIEEIMNDRADKHTEENE